MQLEKLQSTRLCVLIALKKFVFVEKWGLIEIEEISQVPPTSKILYLQQQQQLTLGTLPFLISL